jgi:hypothetical protein
MGSKDIKRLLGHHRKEITEIVQEVKVIWVKFDQIKVVFDEFNKEIKKWEERQESPVCRRYSEEE